MFRPALLALLAAIAGAAPVVAQSGTSAANISATAQRPAPARIEAYPARATVSGHLTTFTRGFMQVQTQYSANVISETLAAAMQRSRNSVRTDAKPIPEAIRRELTPFFSEALLKDVRYTIGDTSQAGLAGFAIRNGRAAAVTLIDTIVFKDESYVSSLALWAHELHHVEQYADWGLSGFAARYAFGWKDVEAAAGARASAYVAWYRERKGLN